jgi:hypothetical protein
MNYGCELSVALYRYLSELGLQPRLLMACGLENERLVLLSLYVQLGDELYDYVHLFRPTSVEAVDAQLSAWRHAQSDRQALLLHAESEVQVNELLARWGKQLPADLAAAEETLRSSLFPRAVTALSKQLDRALLFLPELHRRLHLMQLLVQLFWQELPDAHSRLLFLQYLEPVFKVDTPAHVG